MSPGKTSIFTVKLLKYDDWQLRNLLFFMFKARENMILESSVAIGCYFKQ
jgi:hypothetical protein